MHIVLNEINENEFNNIQLPILFEDKLTDRVFGIITYGENKFKISWQSFVSKPKILKLNNSICSIGIDLVFVIANLLNGEIQLKLSLDYFFYDVKIYNEIIFVITELEIIKIKRHDFIIINTISLPDYFKEIKFTKDLIIIECINNEIIKMNYSS